MYESIAAIATAPATGGIAVIRISGSTAAEVAGKVFTPAGKRAVKDFAHGQMYYGKIAGSGVTDYGYCVIFRAPRSFTGEDVAELHCHGGVQLSRAILKNIFANGARPAQAGEFTRRAFLNGKISLSSAEGMADMINGQSLAEVRAGSLLYSEKLTNKVKDIQSALTDVLAQLGADADYPEEDIEAAHTDNVKAVLIDALSGVNGLVNAYSGGKKIKNGISVAICGVPNAGKSSLLNAMLGYDKAIVSAEAGTTRDVVEGCIQIDGVNFNLFDTAGIRQSAGSVESIGIQRARRTLEGSDLALLVFEEFGKEEADILSGITCHVIKVCSKTDLGAFSPQADICVSAVTGDGVDKLKDMMRAAALPAGSLDGAFLIEERHYNALCRAQTALSSAIEHIDGYPLDVISIDIKACWDILGEITGETAGEEVIDRIFSKFCVGK
ncbi:MAG: tRNA uridine-5-carboxymethylaminomethyl(34) synthesis GTPase MnmE [Clostridia bacterium]|nr:tRNA uridine-5-carboxymethylaminomethyl(34) synthesis GTPase MnmE [Clostridia bacterium]